MAVTSRTSITDRAINTGVLAVRAAVAVGIPLYLYFHLHSIPTFHSPPPQLIAASVALLSAPSTLYCALGALEGVVRSCAQYFNYRMGTNPAYHWDQCAKEAKTTYGLVRAAISPVAGYTFMVHEWNKTGTEHCRILKKEYLIYAGLRSTARQLKRGLNWSVAQVISMSQTVWNGVCWIKDTTVSGIKWIWKISQPCRELAWNIVITVKNWSLDRLYELWAATKSLRNVIKFVIWDVIAVKVIWRAVIKTLVWELFLKTIVWKCVVKTVILDWIMTKLIWNLISKVVWPIVKGLWEYIVWPIFTFLGRIVGFALGAIAWAVKQAFRGAK